MYLKELTINGFKSFAKKSGLEFKTPITAIVGPNGSGKSNVAESFRFALGEQSTSKMRGKKGEDLIFSGSSSVSRANRASVQLTLSNEKRIFPLDFDEIVVERVVHRDGSNEYLVNSSRTRLKDVQSLLAAANIGSTGHHIISQGEADRILTASPKERREMIEDALGLKVYQYKKKESEQKLRKTLDNIEHVEGLRREVAPHLASLKRQVKKFEKAQDLREELKGVYAEYLYREDVYLTHQKKALIERKETPERRLGELNDLLQKAKTKLQESAKDEKSDELVHLESEISRVRREREEVLRESGTIEGQVSFLERRIADARRKEEAVSEAPIPYAQVKGVKEEMERALEEEDIRAAFQKAVTALKALLERPRDEANTSVEDERELAELKQKQESFKAKLTNVSEEEEKLRAQYEALKKSIEEEHSEEREAEREVFTLMNEKRELESVLERVEEDMRTLTRDTEEFEREVREAVALIRSAASAYKDFQVLEDAENIAHEDRSVQRERRRQLERLKVRLEDLGQGSGDEILKEYNEAKERDEFLAREIEDLEQSVAKLTELIADLTKELDTLFISGIEKINTEFQRFFMLMFGGGEAKLLRVKPKVRKKEEGELFDEEENEEPEGIEIDVKLPNKRVRGLDMLSGGERALTSIALIFAMSQVNPPLFIILDETDAALDEANSRRYGDMITALAEKSQLILITHNRETMSRAGVLYGVTMGNDGVSKLLSIEFDEAVQVAK
ncbi:AAA family ATPase [Candidatus Kaiserbacteria bacterium]|nr:AAA family ATPase [Candidatus Kaiserbacteria bacterium]